MKTRIFHHSEQGFTLVETITALVIFLIVLGFMVPMLANQRLNTLNNEINIGAVAVSQQILDQLRQVDATTLPTSGSTTALPSGASIASISKMGKQYGATISYCPITPIDNYCNPYARHIKVQVSHHGQTVYTVETVYTRFQ